MMKTDCLPAPPLTNKALPRGRVVLEGLDGKFYSGSSPRAVVEAMRRGTWGEDAADLNGYMRQIAARVLAWCKFEIRATDPETFLLDLHDARIIAIRRWPNQL